MGAFVLYLSMGNGPSKEELQYEQPQSFKDFISDVAEANQIGEQLKNEKGESLRFVPNKEEDVLFPQMWRSFCKVQVMKVLDSVLILNSKNLNYKQFYRLFRVMKQYGCLEIEEHKPPKKNLQNAKPLIQSQMEELQKSEANDYKECPICFEFEADTVFPCAHAFCHKCANQWESRSEECPMCREKISADESWLLLDSGDSVEDISKFLYKFL